MKEFVLLMQGDDSQDASPTEMQNRMESYVAWMKKMTEDDHLKGGQPLEPSGALLADKNSVVTDGPFLEPKEIIGGYIILLAQDLEEAVELAKDCPLLEHCNIMVRPVLNLPS